MSGGFFFRFPFVDYPGGWYGSLVWSGSGKNGNGNENVSAIETCHCGKNRRPHPPNSKWRFLKVLSARVVLPFTQQFWDIDLS